MSDFWENLQQHDRHHRPQQPWVENQLPFNVSDRSFWNAPSDPHQPDNVYTVPGPEILSHEPHLNPHLTEEERTRQQPAGVPLVSRAERAEESAAPLAQPQSPRAQASNAIPAPSSSLPSFPIYIPPHQNYDPLRLRRPVQDLVPGPTQHRLVAVHQDNWLDRTSFGDHDDDRFGYFPRALLGQPLDEVDMSSSSDSADESLWGFNDSYSHLDQDLDDERVEPNMPPSHRRSARRDVVDLTSLSTSPLENTSQHQAESQKRSAAADESAGPASKRRRTSARNGEEIDLTNPGPSMEEKLLQAQRQEAIRSQLAAEEGKGPQNMGQRQCVICMESYTNATATSCGHIYCHECLIQALMAGEKNSDRGVGTCPVCRKIINRKKLHHIVPISFMKKETYEKHFGKRLSSTG